MIVNDDTVSDALKYLAQDPHPIALARKDVLDAEEFSKGVFAEAFLDAEGSVDAKKAAAQSDPAYANAKDEEAEAVKEYERHRSRVRAAEMIIEVWRSENANARAAERVR